MGGPGSGSWYRWSSKPVVEDGLRLDLSRLIRQGNVVPGKWVGGTLIWSNVDTGEMTASIGYEANLTNQYGAWMRLHYRHDDKPEDYRVQLTTSVPNYGGKRWWFVCPSKGTRTAKLYLPNGGDWFASRQAYGLVYRSQREASFDRMIDRAHNLRRKLGGVAGSLQPFPKKPKGMHWRTYNRTLDEIEFLEDTSMAMALQKLGGL